MRFFLLFILAVFPLSALAQAPIPESHPVKSIEQQKLSTQEKEKALRQELKDLKNDLEQKRQKMVNVAGNIKANEKKLIALESRIDEKRHEQLEIEVRLGDDKAVISDLILALERMRRVPPEAMIARPGAPMKTAQSAMLLQATLPRIYDRANALKEDLDALKNVMDSLKADRAKALETSKKLESDHKNLSALLHSREKIYAKTAEDVKQRQAELKKISEQASSLKDLVTRIERKQREEDSRRRQQQKATAQKASFKATPVPKTGEAQLPISGLIKVGYGNTDDIGAVSKGLKIQGRDGSLIVAPMGGVVDYSGPFKGYGNIVILRHEKGYHSLIAGLGKIDTVVGRPVSAGEPIGKLNKSSEGEPPVLYYELRYKGKPVNPSKKISGLF